MLSFNPGPPPTVGRPRPLFRFHQHDMALCYPVRCYDVGPNGDRFYGTRLLPRPPRVPVTHVNLAPEFLEMLKAKVPGG